MTDMSLSTIVLAEFLRWIKCHAQILNLERKPLSEFLVHIRDVQWPILEEVRSVRRSNEILYFTVEIHYLHSVRVVRDFHEHYFYSWIPEMMDACPPFPPNEVPLWANVYYCLAEDI